MLLFFIRTKRILTQFKLSRRCSPSYHCGNSLNSLCPRHGIALSVSLQFMNSCTFVQVVSTLLCLSLNSFIYGHICFLKLHPYLQKVFWLSINLSEIEVDILNKYSFLFFINIISNSMIALMHNFFHLSHWVFFPL